MTLVILLLLSALLASCQKKPDNPDPHESDTDAPQKISIDLSEYSIVRPQDASQATIQAAVSLRTELSKLIPKIQLSDDWYAEGSYDTESKEILIGATNREESVQALDTLPEGCFSVTVMGNKIVISAHHELLLSEAVRYFLTTVISGKTTVETEENFSYVSPTYEMVEIVKDGKCNYTLVRGEIAPEYTATLAMNVRQAILDASKIRNVTLELDIYGNTDEREKSELVIGITNRSVSDEALTGVPADSWVIRKVANSLVVNSPSLNGLEYAVNAFIDMIKIAADPNGNICIPVIIATSEGTVQGILGDIPTPDGLTVLSGYRGLNDSFERVYRDAGSADFSAYLTKLTENGYTEYDSHIIAANSFATYIKGNTSVFVSYHEFDSTLRVISETYKSLPNITAETYETVTTTKIAQLAHLGSMVDSKGQTLYNFGMGYIMTLADGSYVLIDGGLDRGDDQESLYRYLVTNNKRTDGKIVIAAWIFTHDHPDHVALFIKFTNQYASNVTVEQLVYNFPQAYEGPGDIGVLQTQFLASLTKYPEAKVITAHAGQRMIIRNIEVEFLFAHEMLSPYFVEQSNNSCLVFRVKAEGQTIIFLGDIQQVPKISAKDAPALLCEMYGSALKSDIVQVAHHGLRGGSIELYALIDPDVALWPVAPFDLEASHTYASSGYLLSMEAKNELIIYYSLTETVTIGIPYSILPSLTAKESGTGQEIDFSALEWVEQN